MYCFERQQKKAYKMSLWDYGGPSKFGGQWEGGARLAPVKAGPGHYLLLHGVQ